MSADDLHERDVTLAKEREDVDEAEETDDAEQAREEETERAREEAAARETENLDNHRDEEPHNS